MAGYGEPDWASPGDASNAVTSNAALPNTNNAVLPTGPTTATASSSDDPAAQYIHLLSVLNICLATLMVALGVLSWINSTPSGVDDATDALLASFLIIFGLLLFCYECMYWMPVAALNKTLRKNFGFFYGLKGKGSYLIFIAFLTIGVYDKDKSGVWYLEWITGIGWLVGGALHYFVSCSIPDANLAYKAPTAGLAQPSQEMRNPV